MNISAPLSKAQKLLGTGEINIDPTTARNGGARSWDERSTGAISISVSDTSAGHATNDNGYGGGDIDNGRSTGRGPSRLGWEQESGVIPRHWGDGHRSNDKSLTVKKSTGALSADYPYTVTDDYSTLRRQESSSTIHTYYEKGNVPLSVSQQTSNSAIARGLPRKAKALLDVDGDFVNRSDSKRRKPPKLDLLMLAGKHRKHHDNNLPPVGPVLGNNYVMKSPSVVSQTSDSTPQHSPNGFTKTSASSETGRPSQPSRGPSRLRAAGDTTHQLYDHYEQMLARHEPSPELEQLGSPMESTICGSPMATPPCFVPLAAPSRQMIRRPIENELYEPSLKDSTIRGSTISGDRFFIPLEAPSPPSHPATEELKQNWRHVQRDSQESEAFTFGPMSIRRQPVEPAATKNDYASSISSRYTRTSKASRTDKSIADADRQVTSVLSLSDSDSDSDVVLSATRSSPLSQRSFQDEPRTTTPVRRPGSARQSRTESRASNRSQGSSFANLNDYLTIPQAATSSQNSRLRADGTRLENSPTSSIPSVHATSMPSPPSSFHDTMNRSTGTSATAGYARDSDCTIRQARVVSIQPVASTVEAASLVSSPVTSPGSRLHATLPQRPATRGSVYSRAADQPTPPLSPRSSKSVEIYLETAEPAKKDTTTANPEEPNKSRFMAVTKQEEMLLAALRNKRARMRENIIAELEEGRGSEDVGDSPGSDKTPSTTPPAQNVSARLEVPTAKIVGHHPPKPVPKRGSSLLSGQHIDSPDRGQRLEQLKALRSGSGSRAGSDRPALNRKPSKTESTKTRTRVPMHLERTLTSPTQSEGSISGQSHDASDYTKTDSISEGETRRGKHEESRPSSRTSSQDRYGSLSRQSSVSSRSGQKQPPVLPRAPSTSRSRTSGLAPPLPIRLKEVPEDVRETKDDVDADDYDDDYDDDSEDGEIDIDAFPAPATHQSVFGGPLKTWGEVRGSWQQPEEKGQDNKPKEKGKEPARSETPASFVSNVSNGTPSGHIRGKKSAVRLSAVGRVDSFSPWLGDDD